MEFGASPENGESSHRLALDTLPANADRTAEIDPSRSLSAAVGSNLRPEGRWRIIYVLIDRTLHKQAWLSYPQLCGKEPASAWEHAVHPRFRAGLSGE